VTGKQWMWKFQHANGTRELGQLHVPVNQPVKLIMTSEDVIHSIFIPAFRMKQDVLPDRYTSTWFQATQPGTYPLFCTQYCGTFHATMGGQVIVLSAADFQKWEAQSKTPGANGVAANPPSRGEKLFARYGCTSCHGAGSAVPAPSLGGLFGRKVLLASGESLIADENYIQESILNPAAKLVSGYQNTMPSFRGQIPAEELTDLVTYIKSLKSKVTHE
jgi:cytochrome c oxidase subunit 2